MSCFVTSVSRNNCPIQNLKDFTAKVYEKVYALWQTLLHTVQNALCWIHNALFPANISVLSQRSVETLPVESMKVQENMQKQNVIQEQSLALQDTQSLEPVSEHLEKQNTVPKIVHTFLPVPFVQQTTILNVQEEIQTLPKDIQIRFNDETNTVECGYDEFTLRALADSYPVIGKIIGYGYRTQFDNYVGEWMLQDDSYRRTCQEFLSEAKTYFSEPSVQTLKRALSLEPERGIKKYVEHMLTKSPGMIFGETHSDEAPKAFLCKEMPFLVSQGVDTFYLEHLCFEGLQKDLDAYFMQNQEMSSALKARLGHLDSGYQLNEYTYTRLVQTAKACGIRRVVSLDTAYSYKAGSSVKAGVKNLQERHAAFMYQALQIYEKEKPKNRFIALIGSTHLTTIGTVSGLGELLHCPDICILQKGQAAKIAMIRQCRVDVSHTNTSYHFPLICQIPPVVFERCRSFGSLEHAFFTHEVRVL